MSLKRGRIKVGGRHGRRWSMARRLALLHIVAVLVSYLVFVFLLYHKQVRQQERADLRVLGDDIVSIKTMLRQPNSRDLVAHEILGQLYEPKPSRLFIRILDRQGRTVLESPDMHRVLPSVAFGCEAQECTHRWQSPTGEHFLLQATRLPDQPFPGPGALLQIATSVDEEIAVERELRLTLFLFVGGGLLFSFIGAYLIIRLGLKPIDDISATAARITCSDMHIRIEEGELPQELISLARSFNEMLERLQEYCDRLSDFASNLAHELRTPINTMRLEAEVALSRERPPEEYRRVISSSMEEFGRLSRTIERMLFVARADIEQQELTLQEVDVAAEVENLFDYYAEAAEEGGIRLEAKGAELIRADQTLFRRALSNLIGNAIPYTPPGGVISVETGRGVLCWEITVRDTGCGIEAEHLPRIFDRFYRAPDGYLRNSEGTGLGLPIVKTIMGLHRGSVEIASRRGEGTAVTLRFPIPPSGKSAEPQQEHAARPGIK